MLKYQNQNKVTSYMHRALPLGIILAHDKLHPWYYQHFIQICSQTGDDNNIVLDYAETINPHSDILIHHKLGYRDMEHITDIVKYLIERIDSKQYVILCMDEYYLSQKNDYQNKHFVHESMIYGYNLQERIFIGYGFNKENMLGELIFGFDEVFNAYEKGKKNYKLSFGYIEYQAVQLLSLQKEDYVFDMEVFLNELTDYLYSTGERKRVCLVVKLEDREDGIPLERIKFGLEVYDDVIYALESMLKGNVLIDYRSFHILSEHKRGILERLEYVAGKHNGFLDNSLIKEYQKVVNKVEMIRLKTFEIVNSNNLPKEQFEYYVKNTVRDIITTKELERDILTRILQILK